MIVPVVGEAGGEEGEGVGDGGGGVPLLPCHSLDSILISKFEFISNLAPGPNRAGPCGPSVSPRLPWNRRKFYNLALQFWKP